MFDANNSIFTKCIAGGIGCGISGFLTNPFDVIKIKNQQFGGAKYGSFAGTATVIFTEEGLRGFYKGAATSVLREMTYSSLRMGLYEPIKDGIAATTGGTVDSPHVKWTSAFSSGAIGAAIFNPVDLVKVRFQSQLPHRPRPYSSIPDAVATIYRTENGIRGLYNGTTPTVVRAAFLTGAQLGSYDVIKNNVLVSRCRFSKDDASTHFAASLIASVVTTTAANPADVVKTRVMNCRERAGGKVAMHVKRIVAEDGVFGFMKGWTASYLRIGPHTVISFVLIEEVRKLMGMSTY